MQHQCNPELGPESTPVDYFKHLRVCPEAEAFLSSLTGHKTRSLKTFFNNKLSSLGLFNRGTKSEDIKCLLTLLSDDERWKLLELTCPELSLPELVNEDNAPRASLMSLGVFSEKQVNDLSRLTIEEDDEELVEEFLFNNMDKAAEAPPLSYEQMSREDLLLVVRSQAEEIKHLKEVRDYYFKQIPSGSKDIQIDSSRRREAGPEGPARKKTTLFFPEQVQTASSVALQSEFKKVTVLCRIKDESTAAKSMIRQEGRSLLICQKLGVGDRENTSEYEFDAIYGSNSTQADLYKKLSPLLESSLDVVVLFVGTPSSGKTFSMANLDEDEAGIMSRLLAALLGNKEVTQVSTSIFNVGFKEVWNLLDDNKKIKVVQFQPQVQNTIVESIHQFDKMVKEAQKLKNGMGHFFVRLTISGGGQDGQLWTRQIILVEVLSELNSLSSEGTKMNQCFTNIGSLMKNVASGKEASRSRARETALTQLLHYPISSGHSVLLVTINPDTTSMTSIVGILDKFGGQR